MDLDSSQQQFSESDATHLRLLAPAGSGKTISLLWRCKRLHQQRQDRTQRFLLFTFTRVARDELRQRLYADDTFADIRESVRVDTLNRWGYNYLRRQINSSLALKTGHKDMFILVKHILRPVWTKHARLENACSPRRTRA